MYEDISTLQSVLRCELCNKPFDKPSTLKRHGYYCRSRRTDGGNLRVRSCISCAKSKARCDGKRPNCSRCAARSFGCFYPVKTPKTAGSKPYRKDVAPTEQRRVGPPSSAFSSGAGNHQGEGSVGDLIFESGGDVLDDGFENLGGDLRRDDLSLDFADFVVPHTFDDPAQYPSWSSSLVPYDSISSVDQTAPNFQKTFSSYSGVPASLTYSLRSLIQRPRAKTGSTGTANLILHTLKSYPLMMLRHNTLPPFIHPQTLSSNVEGDSGLEPLNNCISLLHMVKSGVRGSRKLFWKNVRMECERFCQEYLKLGTWDLLAAMQALSIYLIIRLDEGETDDNDFDYLLLAAVKAIAPRLNNVDLSSNLQASFRGDDLEGRWKDWIFEESRRRLCVIYKVVNLLVYFEPAAMCNLPTDLVIAPLPSQKKLWEADGEVAWKMEYDREIIGAAPTSSTFGLAVNGKLLRLDEGPPPCREELPWNESVRNKSKARSHASWTEWCSGMDGLGGLVLLAVSLIE